MNAECCEKSTRRSKPLGALEKSFFLAGLLFFLLWADSAAVARTLTQDETWSGKVTIEESVVVPAGVTLSIKPGAQLLFSENVGLQVSGRLIAKGSAGKPIHFYPVASPGELSWSGLAFSTGDRDGSELEHITIKGAQQALVVNNSKVSLAYSTLEAGGTGIVGGVGAYLEIRNVAVRKMSSGGIDASVQTRGSIVDSTIDDVTGFGIQTAKKTSVAIRNNQISKAKFGIVLSSDSLPIEGNSIQDCEVGIALVQISPNTILRGNRITRAKVGIGCRQFSSPLIEGNIIEECEVGLDCFQAASPMVRQNSFVKNKTAISCVQMCNPVVTLNQFADNEKAIYLHLSSYAQIQENNFERNRLHIELDNMSYDWEVRASKKPKRQLQAQNDYLAQQGRAPAKDVKVEVQSEGFVDARGNYWGEATTREMMASGLNANISSIQDGYDVPVRTYEGWPGEYKQDRVNYSGWKKEKVASAGPQLVSSR